MSLSATNITVGAGRLYIASVGDALPDYASVAASGGRLYTAFDADANWRSLGYTDGGVEVGYEPTYSDIQVDQLKDAAKVFLESETMSFSTSLVEATLENLILAWGRNESDSLTRTDANNGTFTLGVGRDVACEHQIAIMVPGPGSTASCDSGASVTTVERIYVGNRIVSVDGSTHGYRRSEATMFPVNFRALPYDQASAGEEYGKVQDVEIVSA